ncbi:MAG: cytochrome C biogenesis protein, partial [Methylobacteriaceae bacterium]|nr:cytochrome C biogenesis protein [Methylobacteriaceae bacterium]
MSSKGMIRTGLLLAAMVAASPALALESAPVASARAVVTLATEANAAEPGKPFRIGLRFRLAQGWHIYWMNPGDAGQAPELDLTLPVGAKASAISWPAPLRLAEGPVMTFSYIGEVLLPITVTPAQDAASLPIDAKASWLVCEKICIPEEGGFHLYVPLGTPSPSPQAPLFAVADARIPRPSPYRATLAPDGTLSLGGEGISTRSVKDAWLFPSAWGPIDQAAPQKLTV